MEKEKDKYRPLRVGMAVIIIALLVIYAKYFW